MHKKLFIRNKLLPVFLLFMIGASIFLPLSVQAQERVRRGLSPEQQVEVQEFEKKFNTDSNNVLEQYQKERDAGMTPRIITMGVIVIIASLIPYIIFNLL